MTDRTEILMTWDGKDGYLARQLNGFEIPMGTYKGKPAGSPMQLLLVALAGCTAMDIVSILRKKHAHLTGFSVRVSGVRAKDYPQVWKELQVTYLLWGTDLKEKEVEQAITLSEEKYCSVGAMLRESAKLTSEYKILAAGEKE